MVHWNIRKIYMPIFLGSSLLIFSSMTYSQSSSANYQIPLLTPSEGGGQSASQNYQIQINVGQPASGQAASANYAIDLGSPPTNMPICTNCLCVKKGCKCNSNTVCTYASLNCSHTIVACNQCCSCNKCKPATNTCGYPTCAGCLGQNCDTTLFCRMGNNGQNCRLGIAQCGCGGAHCGCSTLCSSFLSYGKGTEGFTWECNWKYSATDPHVNDSFHKGPCGCGGTTCGCCKISCGTCGGKGCSKCWTRNNVLVKCNEPNVCKSICGDNPCPKPCCGCNNANCNGLSPNCSSITIDICYDWPDKKYSGTGPCGCMQASNAANRPLCKDHHVGGGIACTGPNSKPSSNCCVGCQSGGFGIGCQRGDPGCIDHCSSSNPPGCGLGAEGYCYCEKMYELYQVPWACVNSTGGNCHLCTVKDANIQYSCTISSPDHEGPNATPCWGSQAQ